MIFMANGIILSHQICELYLLTIPKFCSQRLFGGNAFWTNQCQNRIAQLIEREYSIQ